jgi:hypothetical protein
MQIALETTTIISSSSQNQWKNCMDENPIGGIS